MYLNRFILNIVYGLHVAGYRGDVQKFYINGFGDCSSMIYFCKNTAMKDRLLQLMQYKDISANKLAEMIGVQPSGISHILSGRNKPSADFIIKLLSTFPDVNPEWFIMGAGSMVRNGQIEHSGDAINGLSNDVDNSAHEHDSDKLDETAHSVESMFMVQEKIIPAVKDSTSRRIIRVLLLYSDHTVDIYNVNDIERS